jgi:hypothetical protein
MLQHLLQKILQCALYCNCEPKHRQIQALRPVFPWGLIIIQPWRSSSHSGNGMREGGLMLAHQQENFSGFAHA